MKTIIFTQDTWLKKDPTRQSSDLPQHMKFFIKGGTVFPIKAIAEADHDHVKFTLDSMTFGWGKANYNTWFAYEPHTDVVQQATPVEAPRNPKPINKNGSLAERVAECCEARGYPLDKTPGHVNIISIEGMDPDGDLNADTPNLFNDCTGLLVFDSNGIPYFKHLFKSTTEPGTFWTTSSSRNSKGAARIVLGFHDRVWQVGMHKDRKALVQTGNKIRVHRDYNMDYSRVGDKIDEGWFGINFHPCSSRYTPTKVDKWSAGCTVIPNWKEYYQIYDAILESPQYKSNHKYRFSYIVLLGSWLV